MHLSFTYADQAAGFPQLHAALSRCDSADLQRAYLEGNRDSLNALCGRTAAVLQREIAKELLVRGITTIPNLFGPITITIR